MTFEEFIATRRRVDSLSAAIGVEVYDAAGEVDDDKGGYVYEGNLYIEIEKDGNLSLQIMRDSYAGRSWELPELEKMLYLFGVDEGTFT